MTGASNIASSSRMWLVYLLAGTFATVVYFLLPSVTAQDVFSNLVGISAVAAAVVGILVNRPLHSLAWCLLTFSVFLLVAGDIVGTYYESILLTEVPSPSVADALYLAALSSAAAGTVLVQRVSTMRRQWPSIVDALIITSVAGMFAWVFLIDLQADDQTHSLLERLIAIGYPLVDLVLLVAVLRLLLVFRKSSPAYYLLGMCLGFLLLTDIAYAVSQLSDTYETGNPIDAGWLLFYVFFGAAALHPSMSTISEPTSQAETRLTWRRFALLTGTLLIAPVAMAYQALSDQDIDVPLIAGGSLVLFLLVATRMAGLINEREQAEKALKESEEKFRLLAENAQDLIYRLRIEPAFEFEYISPSATAITGYTPEEHYADPDLGLKIIHPDDLQRLHDHLRSPELLDKPLILRWIRKDELVIWVEQRDKPIYDAEGSVVAIEGIVRDVTQRKQAEDELRFQKALLEAQSEASIDGIMVSGEEGKILFFNRRFMEMWGIPEEVMETSSEEPVLQSILEEVIDPQGFLAGPAKLQGQPDQEIRDEILLRDGRTLDRYGALLKSVDDDYYYGQVWYFRDITERKQAEEGVKEANRRLKELAVLKAGFTTMVAHELDTPLAVIRGFTDLLAADELEADERTQAFIKIQNEIEVLRKLVDDVRAAATVEREDFAVELRPIPVTTLLDDATRFAAIEPEAHPLTIENTVDESVWADRQRIGQVLRNLLSNAAKYSPEGKPIELRAKPGKTPGYVRIEVVDHGPGVHPEDVRRIFEKFGRGRDRLGRKVAGVGVGLYLSRRIVQAHGSDLMLDTTPACGSTFSFELEAVE